MNATKNSISSQILFVTDDFEYMQSVGSAAVIADMYACPKGTIYQDVSIYIKFYICMSRLDYTDQDLRTRKTRFQYTYQDLRTRIKICLRVHQV